jgi:hypothetical protein
LHRQSEVLRHPRRDRNAVLIAPRRNMRDRQVGYANYASAPQFWFLDALEIHDQAGPILASIMRAARRRQRHTSIVHQRIEMCLLGIHSVVGDSLDLRGRHI